MYNKSYFRLFYFFHLLEYNNRIIFLLLTQHLKQELNIDSTMEVIRFNNVD